MPITIQASIIANGQYVGSAGPAPYVYLLDDYPNASMAYSCRKLYSGYSGPCMKVTRSSDRLQADIGFNDQNELDVESLLAFVQDSTSATVSTWYDQSGNGRDLIQSFSDQQPLIYSGGIIQTLGTKPALVFNGEEIYLSYNSVGPFYESTVAFTAQSNSSIGENIGISLFYIDEVGETGIIRTIDNGGIIPPIPYTYRATETEQDIEDLTYPDGSFYFNGNELTTSNGADTYHLGFVNSGSGKASIGFKALFLAQTKNWVGSIQEYIVWESNYAAARPAIQNNINSYYNIY